jgi:4-hydroxy-tetrahydrodipicolinate synthase
MTDWRGVFPAATTQFRPDGSLDIESTIRHLHLLVDEGVNGLILLGTVGENGSLDPEEKIDLLREAGAAIDGRVPVLAGVSERSTRQAMRFVEQAEAAGVDGFMVLPGVGYKSDSRETASHFRQVFAATSLPCMAYNNPVSYGVDVKPEEFAELADVENLVAIKESSDDVRRVTDLVNVTGDRFAIFCGVDDLALEACMLGAVGWVSGLVNAFPAENRLVWDLATAGRWAEAREVYRWYMPLLHLDTHVKLVQYIKFAMQLTGLGSETVRPPRLPLVGEERSRIERIVRDAIASRPNPSDYRATA